MMNPKIDAYLADGCMRCKLGGTPECKVHNWQPELKLLRSIVLECGLQEERKWDVPCYTWQGHNILVVAAFKAYASISFFKGALLSDHAGMLQSPGEHSQAGRLIKYTDARTISKQKADLKAYIFEAIEVEKAGLKVAYKPVSEFPVPEEFQQKLDQMPALKKAFEALTPGRQRAYLLHFGSAKQAQTRAARVEKWIPNILSGKGYNE
jgi:uncharacterized protein YdeI (YjbR/CyaY-like superfamily)